MLESGSWYCGLWTIDGDTPADDAAITQPDNQPVTKQRSHQLPERSLLKTKARREGYSDHQATGEMAGGQGWRRSGIEVSALQFGYDGQLPLFARFNLRVAPGSRCLLVGANGSGMPNPNPCSQRLNRGLSH
jgi:ATPase subunit of ABC transporter with duplicated ATPase domains